MFAPRKSLVSRYSAKSINELYYKTMELRNKREPTEKEVIIEIKPANYYGEKYQDKVFTYPGMLWAPYVMAETEPKIIIGKSSFLQRIINNIKKVFGL